MPASCSDTFQMVLCKSSRARSPIEQASHYVWSVWVSVPKSYQHMVAHLGNKNKTTVGPYFVAAATIGCHHPNPIRSNVPRLPIHLHFHTTVTEFVIIPGYLCHLWLGYRHVHIRKRQIVGYCGNSPELVAVIALFAYRMCDVDDDELPKGLARNTANAFQKGTGQFHNAPHGKVGMLTSTNNVV